jgi:hypothetical protein
MRLWTTPARPTEAYPFNPNGSPGGLTAVTTADGRFTALMPHPERVFRNIQMSWTSGDKSAHSPGCRSGTTRASGWAEQPWVWMQIWHQRVSRSIAVVLLSVSCMNWWT